MNSIDVSLFCLPDSRGKNQFMMLGGKTAELERTTNLGSPCATFLRVFRSQEELLDALAPLSFAKHRLDRYAEALQSGGSVSFDLREEQAGLIGMTEQQSMQPRRVEPERRSNAGERREECVAA